LYEFDFVDAVGDAIIGIELETTALNVARSWSIVDLNEGGGSGILIFLPDGERLQGAPH